MLEGIEYLLQRYGGLSAPIDCLPNMAVCATAHLLEQFKALENMFLDLFAHFLFIMELYKRIFDICGGDLTRLERSEHN